MGSWYVYHLTSLARRLRAVLYTGSGNVGKIIAGAAAKTLSPSTLEVSPLCLATPVTLLTVARRQEPSHRFLLCRPQDFGKADVEYQAVECRSGEPKEG